MTTETTSSNRADISALNIGNALLGVFRIALGWILLWAGIDKVFGLGFDTARSDSVLDGTSPTAGFLAFGVNPGSPIAGMLSSWSGSVLVDALYLLSTVGAGLALLLGIGTRIAGIGGALLFATLWLASLPLEYNPILDQHAVYAIACLMLAFSPASRYLGLGAWWQGTPLAGRTKWLA